jgi:PAS domain S-box-containing protein
MAEDSGSLKDRALSAAAEGITIADARLPDRPLIYVNEGFVRLTGYPRDAVLGRNCRFLQGAGTDAETVTEIRRAMDSGRECTVEILNYRRDGLPFWNRLSITPVRDLSGNVTHFIAVQSDVSERRRAEEELRRAKAELEGALDELSRDLELAARVQRSFLPKTTPEIDGIQVAWEFRPCAQLAGDFLGAFPLDDHNVALYVLDVSGHGASAALLSVTVSRWLSPVPAESCLFRPADDGKGFTIHRPRDVAALLNERFQIDPRLPQYFTLVYGVLHVPSGRLDYVAAGHPGPVHIPEGGPACAYPSTAPPIGLLPKAEFEESSLTLASRDRLFLYSDGLIEAVNARDEALGPGRLVHALETSRSEALDDVLRFAVARMEEFQGRKPAEDDVSLLAVEMT